MQTPKLSVNVNKFALLRNSRGSDKPNLVSAVDACLAAGAQGITVHPRMDQRHVKFSDVPVIAAHLRERHPGIELNIECEPSRLIIDLVLETRPAQCTLVPVSPGEVTSDHGWDLPNQSEQIASVIARLKFAGIRVSLFMDCDSLEGISHAAELDADRIELYTGPYAWAWGTEYQEQERQRMFTAARAAERAGLQLNAGHDLDRHNLLGLRDLPGLLEVSIGHEIVCRALEVGTAQAIREILDALDRR